MLSRRRQGNICLIAGRLYFCPIKNSPLFLGRPTQTLFSFLFRWRNEPKYRTFASVSTKYYQTHFCWFNLIVLTFTIPDVSYIEMTHALVSNRDGTFWPFQVCSASSFIPCTLYASCMRRWLGRPKKSAVSIHSLSNTCCIRSPYVHLLYLVCTRETQKSNQGLVLANRFLCPTSYPMLYCRVCSSTISRAISFTYKEMWDGYLMGVILVWFRWTRKLNGHFSFLNSRIGFYIVLSLIHKNGQALCYHSNGEMSAVWCFTDGTCHWGGEGGSSCSSCSSCSFILRFYLLLSSLLFAFLSLISVNPMPFSCLFDWMMPRLNPLFVVAFVSFSSSFQSSHDPKVSWLWVLLVSESKLSL